MRDLPLRRIPLLQLLELDRHVGDGSVELARDEVARPERLEDLRELATLLRDELEHQEERHDARVGLREVAEVVVAGHLAAERSVLLAHAVLQEAWPARLLLGPAAGPRALPGAAQLPRTAERTLPPGLLPRHGLR